MDGEACVKSNSELIARWRNPWPCTLLDRYRRVGGDGRWQPAADGDCALSGGWAASWGGGLRSLREQGIESLVSLLSAEEMRVLGLEDEARLCREVGIGFRWFPVTDHSIPESMEEYRALVEELQRDLRAGKGVGAHCFAGIGRSCMLMAGVLCAEGLSADEAFARLSAARGLTVPDTWLQKQWVEPFCRVAGGARRTVLIWDSWAETRRLRLIPRRASPI